MAAPVATGHTNDPRHPHQTDAGRDRRDHTQADQQQDTDNLDDNHLPVTSLSSSHFIS